MLLPSLFCIILYFAPHALHYVIVTVICICVRSRGAKNGSSSGGEVRWAIGGPQAPKVTRMLTLLRSRQVSVHLTTILEFILFFLYINYDPWMCIKLLGVVLIPSCITTTF
jgi:hypothetical protein